MSKSKIKEQKAKSQSNKKEIPFYVYNQDVPFNIRFGLMQTIIGVIPLDSKTDNIINIYKDFIKILADNSEIYRSE